jgi:acetylserotonin N-methyltransferase
MQLFWTILTLTIRGHWSLALPNVLVRRGLGKNNLVLGAESNVGGNNENIASASSGGNELDDAENDNSKEWTSPSLLWSRRDTGLAAAASLIAGPLFLQRETFFSTPTTTANVLSTATSTAAATAALEAGDALIRNIWLGRLAYPTLIVALEMGLFEALKDRPLSLDQLGRKLQPKLSGASSRALEAVTSVLLSLGLVEWTNKNHNAKTDMIDRDVGVVGDGSPIDIQNLHLSLTESARAVLLRDSPFFWGAQLLAADGVTATLRRRIQLESRNSAADSASTSGIVAYDSHSDQVIDSFIDSMQSHSAVTAEATAKALEGVLPLLSEGSCHVLDMAGGSGCFSLALAKHYPNVKVTLADLPNVVASWKRRHQGATASVVQRIDAVPANLFDGSTWPRDCQVVLLANVLHDWGDMQALDILSNARLALTSSTKDCMVVIVEQLLNYERTGPLPAALASISMLLGDWRTGKQYTLAELKELAQHAGFRRVELGPKCGSFHHAVLCHTL